MDGGVDFKTVADCAQAGADTFISGTTLFSQHNMGSAVRKLRKIAEGANLKAHDALKKPLLL